jgi:hypothetical protein
MTPGEAFSNLLSAVDVLRSHARSKNPNLRRGALDNLYAHADAARLALGEARGTKVEFFLCPDDITWEDSDPDDGRGLVRVEIFGVAHHLCLVPVTTDAEGVQRGRTTYADSDLDALQALYEVSAYTTVEVPGREGEYVVYLHPAED